MDRGAWQATVHGVAEDMTEHTHTYTQSAEDPFSKSKYVGASTARIPPSYPRLILIQGILPLVPAPSPV